ncbi:hypothetical protein Nepgr_000623 [Nepenthes gracilis]|uniref:Shugoshin C-terminal domain-containing protein n=1 Tax=Nepenthes gracilis TaxID=150966 RepID=A0AAD3P371_NEPGR|nr:hypothetical protein Nepgr_000623 [Nepenthes gracilis]
MVKRSSFGNIVRKRLSDITNLHSYCKSPAKYENATATDSSTKNDIDRLFKENLSLLQHLQEKNKLVELSGLELRKLRISLQKIQLQNWHLAQTNSHILAELNLGKEKLKDLQHELACKDALLKAKTSELEDKEKILCPKTGSQEGEPECAEQQAGNHLKQNNDNKKPSNYNKRRPTRSRSMGDSAASQTIMEKEMAENKRRCLRRQSATARTKSCEELHDELFETNANFLVSQPINEPRHEKTRSSLDSSISIMEKPVECDLKLEAGARRRSSVGRPLRRAAEKVQSYKEAPLNVKMRRSE